MSQPTISAFFPSRKRTAAVLEDGESLRKGKKVFIVENQDASLPRTPTKSTCVAIEGVNPSNLVKFYKKGLLSPHKLRITFSDAIESATNRSDGNTNANCDADASAGVSDPISKTINDKQEQNLDDPAKNFPSKSDGTATRRKTSQGVDLNAKQLTKKISDASRIKATIKGHEKLPEFKERINRLRKNLNCDGKALSKDKDDLQPKLEKFKSVEIEVLSPTKCAPSSSISGSIRPLHLTPVKTPSEPAYQRYQHLHQNESSSLPLPANYRTLAEVFRAVDVICATLFNRNEKITFKRLKIAVQRMTKKNFVERDLGRIKAVYPNALNLTVEKFRNFGSESKYETYQLVIIPNYSTSDNGESNDKTKKTQLLATRYKTFNKKLLDMVKTQHAEFLSHLVPPIVVDADAIARWHPEFPLNNCPNIISTDLPKMPQEATFTSAQQILSTARNLFSSEEPPADGCSNAPKINPEVKTPVAASSLLKGLPTSLIEKIKQKQNAKALSHITKSSSAEPTEEWSSSLPALIRHIKNIYIAEKKSVMPFETVIGKIHNSYGSTFNTNKLEIILKSLATKFPDLFSIQIVRKQTFFKLNRNEDFSKINNKVNTMTK